MANRNIYSVAQVNSYIKNMFAQDFMLRQVSIKGEVSNCKYHTSGHIYFTIKDAGAAMNAIMFAGSRASGLSFHMKEGDQVIVTGSVEVYEKTGAYQLYAKKIELDGEGNLYLKFEQLKHELEEMGMFSAEYKQPIPRYAGRIGVVTAPTGAAVQDIRNVSSRRNPYVQVILYPALVQGEGAAASIVRGIRILDEAGVDVIIVGRGGGSIEELWAFNEEEVARAIFECHTPVISAVGHETDFTIADFVADLRAPTPSAAAELAYFDCRTLLGSMQGYQERLERAVWNKIDVIRAKLERYGTRLQYLNPESRLRDRQQYAADVQERIQSAMEQKIKDKRHRLSLYLERFHGLSPLRKLNQGYSYVSDKEGKTLTSVSQVKQGDSLLIYVTDGTIEASVQNTKASSYGADTDCEK